MKTPKRSVLAITCLALAAASLTAGPPASARGVTLIQESNGTVKTYSDVYMALGGQMLTLRSPDKRGTLRILTGACSFDKSVERCLPYSVTLTQGGKTHKIAISPNRLSEHYKRSPSSFRSPRTAGSRHRSSSLQDRARNVRHGEGDTRRGEIMNRNPHSACACALLLAVPAAALAQHVSSGHPPAPAPVYHQSQNK